MAAVIALVLVLVALGACLLPLLDPEQAVHPADRVAERTLERERLLAAIRDSDMDLAMGKISAADHAELRASLESQAVAVLAAIDREPRDPGGAAA